MNENIVFELSVLGAILIIVGLFFVFKVDPLKFLHEISAPMRSKRNVKDRYRLLIGKSPGFFRKQRMATQQMLDSAEMGDKAHYYKWASLVLGIIGFLGGLALQNIGTAIVLTVGLAMMPIVYVQIRTGEYIRSINEVVETSLAAVTSVYVQTGDFIGAVQATVDNIPAPLDKVFRQFLVDVEMIDANVVKGIQKMSEKLDRRYFKEWCSVLIQCQNDRELRYALPGIVERLSEMRQVQMEVDTVIRRVYVDYAMVVCIMLGAIPIMGFMMDGWLDALMFTLAGKIVLTFVLAVIFITTIGVIQSNRPIDMD